MSIYLDMCITVCACVCTLYSKRSEFSFELGNLLGNWKFFNLQPVAVVCRGKKKTVYELVKLLVNKL